MSSRYNSYFHYLIGFKFNNSKGYVSTSYLDTYNRNFKHGSTVDTYNIHEKVFSQFCNSFERKFYIVLSTKKFNNDRKFESVLKINNYNTGLLASYFFYIINVIDIINESEKYELKAEGYVECINQVIKQYNNFINNVKKYKLPDYKLPIYVPNPPPLHHTLTAEYHKPPLRTWASFEPAYPHGTFDTEFDIYGRPCYTHYLDF